MADAGKAKKVKTRPDLATIAGIVMAVAGLIGGLILEGGEIKDISQLTAGLIVLGGTFGATLINTPLHTVLGGLKRLRDVFLESSSGHEELIDQLIDYATKARKNGIVSLERETEGITDPYLKKALSLAVDGTDILEIRKMLELDMAMEEHHIHSQAKVFEVAGGYAPTIGIIGAVMGLIQVMKNLADIEKVGHGIAVSFVATVYGVGLSNLLLLPSANKIKARGQERIQYKELVLEGIIGIVEGMNPKLIKAKLDAYATASHGKKKSKSPVGAAEPASQEA